MRSTACARHPKAKSRAGESSSCLTPAGPSRPRRLRHRTPADHPGLLDVLEQARALGFLGPGPVEAHIEHALAFATAVPAPPARALDLGSGGGVPGLALALHWPASRWTLLDAGTRRAAFLHTAAAALGVSDRVEVLAARAESAGRDPELRGAFDLVVSRSFGSPAVTGECAAPFLRVGGSLVVSEPPEPSADRWPAATVLAELGLDVRVTVAGPPRLQVLSQRELCSDRYPRRVGVPAKRPLW
jgi:16S rRNA (guanine527-N7)-methyltransferase